MVMTSSGHVTVVLGSQWGDEGKGKVVDLLAEQVDGVARCQVGGLRVSLKFLVLGSKFPEYIPRVYCIKRDIQQGTY